MYFPKIQTAILEKFFEIVENGVKIWYGKKYLFLIFSFMGGKSKEYLKNEKLFKEDQESF